MYPYKSVIHSPHIISPNIINWENCRFNRKFCIYNYDWLTYSYLENLGDYYYGLASIAMGDYLEWFRSLYNRPANLKEVYIENTDSLYGTTFTSIGLLDRYATVNSALEFCRNSLGGWRLPTRYEAYQLAMVSGLMFNAYSYFRSEYVANINNAKILVFTGAAVGSGAGAPLSGLQHYLPTCELDDTGKYYYRVRGGYCGKSSDFNWCNARYVVRGGHDSEEEAINYSKQWYSNISEYTNEGIVVVSDIEHNIFPSLQNIHMIKVINQTVSYNSIKDTQPTYHGYDDWRLPTLNEAKRIVSFFGDHMYTVRDYGPSNNNPIKVSYPIWSSDEGEENYQKVACSRGDWNYYDKNNSSSVAVIYVR